jgi:hypothetical protein
MNPTRTMLIAASLLMLGVLGAQPAAACTSTFGPPGTPTGGVLGSVEWYADAVPYTACSTEAAVETAANREVDEVQEASWDVINGVGPLLETGLLLAAANNYASLAQWAAQSQYYDVCSAFLGSTNPPCLTDIPTDQTQKCGNGLAVPKPVAGGIVGGTAENSNGLLQGTCALQSAAGSAVPDGNEVAGYALDGATALAGQAENAALDMADAVNDGAGDLAENSLKDFCVLMRGQPACI